MKVIRYSGIRLDRSNYTYPIQLQTVVQNVFNAAKDLFKQALQEPLLYYDNDKQVTIKDLIGAILSTGELFILYDDDKPIGYAGYRNVLVGRYANSEIYLLPEYRKSLILGEFRDVLCKAIFSPWPEGLQLLKVRAYVHPDNTPCLTGCKNSGFVEIATLPYEGLYQGVITNMIYLELYPAAVQDARTKEDVIHVRTKGTRKRRSVPNAPDNGSGSLNNSPEVHA